MNTKEKKSKSGVDGLYLQGVLEEIRDQPAWRAQANRESDYKDGNQLDSDVLREQEEKGIPSSIENVIGPALDDITGMEAKTRKDLRATPDNEAGGKADDVVAAIDYKINQAERRSGADDACSEAYVPQVGVGVGWVEVSRETDPFKFPYRCKHVHRNEIHWDFQAREKDLSDARWLLRRKWADIEVVKGLFPGSKDLIERLGTGWNAGMDDYGIITSDSEADTGLAQSSEIQRGWSVEEQEWRHPGRRRICVFELQTRKWMQVLILVLPDGRVVEFDRNDNNHNLAIAVGIQPVKRIVTRIYKTFMLGPHVLHEEESEFKRFSYVPFWGKREDMTRIPYGIIRWLMYLQDEVNVRVSKQQWLLSATRTIRTEGVVAMEDAVFRREIGRADADIILDPEEMGRAGARFEVEQGGDLTTQQAARLLDLRETVKRLSHVSDPFSGNVSRPDNSAAMAQAIEQSIQGLAKINDNYEFARQYVGDLLLTLIINDLKDKREEVYIKGSVLKDDRLIVLNDPTEEDGQRFLTNDVYRTKLQITLADVPATSSFRQQQLQTLDNTYQTSPDEFKPIILPHLLELTDIPNKEDIIKAIREKIAAGNYTEEIVQQQITEAVAKAKMEWQYELKSREITYKERKSDAEVDKIFMEKVAKAIEAIFSATQAGAQIISMPGVAGAADQTLLSAGFPDANASPIVAQPATINPGVNQVSPVQQNTSPMFPPRAEEAADSGAVLSPAPPMSPLPSPVEGMMTGIEKQGFQSM